MSKLLSVEPFPNSIRPVPEPSGQERAASPEQLEKEHMEAKVHIQMLERTDANLNRLNRRLERLEGQLDQWTEPPRPSAVRAPTHPAPHTRRGNLAAALVVGVIGGAIASYLFINHWAATSQGSWFMGAPSLNLASPEHAQTAEIAVVKEPALQAQPSTAIAPVHALETETPERAPEPARAPQQAAGVPADAPLETATQKADVGPIAPAPSDAAPAPEPASAQIVKSADPRDSSAHAAQRSAKPAVPRYRVVEPSDGRIAL